MRRGTILPIAVMAFAVAAFVFIVFWAVSPGYKWPWSTNAPDAVPVKDDAYFIRTYGQPEMIPGEYYMANVNGVMTNTQAFVAGDSVEKCIVEGQVWYVVSSSGTGGTRIFSDRGKLLYEYSSTGNTETWEKYTNALYTEKTCSNLTADQKTN